MKKLFTLLLAAIMLMSVLAACGSNDPSPPPAAPAADPAPAPAATEDPAANVPPPDPDTVITWPLAEPVTLTVYMGGTLVTNDSQFSDTRIGQIVKEKTNVTLEIEYLGAATDVERAAIIIAGGQYHDIIIAHHEQDTFWSAGALIDITDYYYQYANNIQANWGDYINRVKNVSDGRLYGLSSGHMNNGGLTNPDAAFFLKYSAVAANGHPMVTTADEYFDIIRRYVADNPGMIGFSGPAEDWRFIFATHGGRKMHGWHNTGRFLMHPRDDYRAHAAHMFEFNRDYFMFLRDLRLEGLLDPEFFSQSHDEYVAKVASGRVVGFYDEWWQVGSAFSIIRQEERLEDLMVPYAIYHPDRVTGLNCSFSGVSAMTAWADIGISIHADDPALIIQFYDFLASDEMQELLWWGEEGVDFQRDANGRRYLTEAQYIERDDPSFSNTTGITHAFATGVPTRINRDQDWPDGSGVTDPALDRVVRPQYLYDPLDAQMLRNLGWASMWEPFGDRYVSPYGFGWDIRPPDGEDPEEEKLHDMFHYLNGGGGMGEFGMLFWQHMVMAATEAEALAIWDDMQQWLLDNGVRELEEYFTMRVRERIEEWN